MLTRKEFLGTLKAIFEKVENKSKSFINNIYDLTIKKLINLEILHSEAIEVDCELFKKACLNNNINIRDFIDHLQLKVGS